MPQPGRKYHVVRNDDKSPVDDAFVLRVKKDPVGWLATWYYANLTANTELAEGLKSWLMENIPSNDSLGSEGRLNRQALELVQEVLNLSRQ